MSRIWSKTLNFARLKWPSPKEPHCILPFELWELVLDDLTNDGLLQTACVCRGFNDLSLAIYFRRHDITAETKSLDVPSYILRALHLSCGTPGFHGLRCKFRTFDVLRHMRSLREVVAKYPDLTHISLEWSDNLFYGHRYDRKIPYASRALVTMLRDVLLTVIHKRGGPVIFLNYGNIYRFEPKEFSRWRLHPADNTSCGRGLIARAKSTLQDNTRCSIPAVELHTHPGERVDVTQIVELTVRSIRIGSGPMDRFTVVALWMGSLVLQPTKSLSSAELSIILPHMVVPGLKTLYLRTDAISPVALAQFVSCHDIRLIEFNPYGADNSSVPATVTRLCSPVAVLPNLTHLCATDGFALAALLDAFESPRMSTISLQVHRSTPIHIVGLKTGLRRLSLRTHPITLKLSTTLASGVHVHVENDERSIVGTLYCVECVCLMDANLRAATSILSWLTMLPALRQLELRLDRSIRLNCDQLELENFLAEARAALPRVAVVDRSLG
ncbi:hypothetical protein B0H19DRAFT_542237 [Mycena capillaripes]|nr:hypothetical protein B0H19DRAFT_542237 [Mycena capillaripes]